MINNHVVSQVIKLFTTSLINDNERMNIIMFRNYEFTDDELIALESMLLIVNEAEEEVVLENYKIYPYGKGDGKGPRIMVRSHRENHKTDTAKQNPTGMNNVHDLSIKLYNIPINKNGKKEIANGEEFRINRKLNKKTNKREFAGIDKSEWEKISRKNDRAMLEYFINTYFNEISAIWDSMNDYEAEAIFNQLDAACKADKQLKKFR